MIIIIPINIIYILQYILLITTARVCGKTYEVRRINESTFIVASFPANDDRPSKNSFTDKPEFYDATYDLPYLPNLTTASTSWDFSEPEIKKPKVSAEYIAKARQNYFLHHYSSSRKPNCSGSLSLPVFSSLRILRIRKEKERNMMRHLETVRGLAGALDNQIYFSKRRKKKR